MCTYFVGRTRLISISQSNFFFPRRGTMVTYIKDSRARVVRCIRSVPGSITADRLNANLIRANPIYIYICIYVRLFRVCAYPDAGNNLSSKSNGNRMNSIIRLWRMCARARLSKLVLFHIDETLMSAA